MWLCSHPPHEVVGAAGRHLMIVEDIQTVPAPAPGVVEGVKHQFDPFSPVCCIYLGIADVIAYSETCFDTSDIQAYQSLSGGIAFLITPGTLHMHLSYLSFTSPRLLMMYRQFVGLVFPVAKMG